MASTPIRIEVVLEATSPIAHHAEVMGNTAIAMRRKVRLTDGSFANVPIITGDTMRHSLREGASRALLDAADMLEPGSLSESALRLLFAGGMVVGGDSGSVKLDDYKSLCDLLPHMKLLGGCAQNRVIPGRMQVDDATLVCDESRALWPSWLEGWLSSRSTAVDSCRAHVDEEMRVRMDPVLRPELRGLITDGGAAVEKRLKKGEAASADGDAKGKDEAKSTMMPRTAEVIVPGSLFFWGISATVDDAFDLDVLHAMLKASLDLALHQGVGGKRGTGHGKLVPRAIYNVPKRRWRDLPKQIEAPTSGAIVATSQDAMAVDLERIDAPSGALFAAHVTARSAKIREYLSQVKS